MPNEFVQQNKIKLIEEISSKINRLDVIKTDISSGTILSSQLESDLEEINCMDTLISIRRGAIPLAIKIMEDKIKTETAFLRNLNKSLRVGKNK